MESKIMNEKMTVKDFFQRFPTDSECLDHIMAVRFGMRHVCGKCGVDSTFHKMADRRAYACAACGAHLYPCAGTIFQDSRTSLQTWFYAIFLFVTTRHGVSGKELQRTLGVTYKTAWRMGQQIRMLMAKADGFEILKDHVEADETYIGGKRKGVGGRWLEGKTIVMGIKQRDGRMVAQTVPDIKLPTLRGVFLKHVEPGTIVSTDELRSYHLLRRDGFMHGAVNHSRGEYVRKGEKTGVLHHTNNLEAFWKVFKSSVRSTHIHVSKKYMNRYLNEFTFRANHRAKVNGMFDLLIASV
jgi:transposase